MCQSVLLLNKTLYREFYLVPFSFIMKSVHWMLVFLQFIRVLHCRTVRLYLQQTNLFLNFSPIIIWILNLHANLSTPVGFKIIWSNEKQQLEYSLSKVWSLVFFTIIYYQRFCFLIFLILIVSSLKTLEEWRVINVWSYLAASLINVML